MATRVLGMKAKEARLLRHVAARLGGLPGLAQQAARGEIEWSKLREVVRVASPETEAVWLDLCMHSSYAQIERDTASFRERRARGGAVRSFPN